MRTQRPQLLVTLIVAATLVCSCRDKRPNDESRAIHAWLTCDDCGSGERGAVAAIGADAVTPLADALRGPSVGQQRIMRGKFDTSYKIADIGTRVPPLTRANYVGFRESNYVATYQKRAATSLGDIGGEAAREALDAAIADSANRHYRPDVIRVIKFSRSRLDAPTFAGKINPHRVSFADVVNIIADSAHPFNGQETVVIEDSLFPANELPHAVIGDTIKFLSIAGFGLHMVSVIRGPNATAPPDKIAMFVSSIVDANDRAMTACGSYDIPCMINNAPALTIPHTTAPPVFLTLSSGTPADSMDFFKIDNAAASSPLAVTVHLEWRGEGTIDLGWKQCNSVNPIGHSAHGAAPQPMQLSDSIPAGQCWVLQISLVGGQGPAYGKLTLTSP
ncbi:MAG: hypothetical protein ACJ793_10945 [Gemmatimonadaceae bacterium]